MRKTNTSVLLVVAFGLIVVLVIVLSWPSVLGMPRYRLVAGASQVVPAQLSGISELQAEAFEAWRQRSDHFGAFAIGKGTLWGSSWGYNDAQAAEKSAIISCGGVEAECRIVARMEPVAAAGDGEVTVSRATLESFLSYEAREGAKAFAVSEAGEAGWAWGYGTPWEAESRALRRCRQEAAIEDGAQQDTPCRVLHAGWW